MIEKPHTTVITSDNSPEGDIRILLRADDEKRTKRNMKVSRYCKDHSCSQLTSAAFVSPVYVYGAESVVIFTKSDQTHLAHEDYEISHLPVKDFMTDANTRLPVFGIDLPGRTLAQLCLQPSDWLSDDEAWKHAQIVLATDRSYATTIRSALAGELSARNAGFVFLYSLRESKVSSKRGRCTYVLAESLASLAVTQAFLLTITK